MLFSLGSRKKHLKKSQDTQVSPIFEETWDEPLPNSDTDGLSLSDFAARSGISEGEVWRRLKRGELIGRPMHGCLTIWAQEALQRDTHEATTLGLDVDLPPRETGAVPSQTKGVSQRAIPPLPPLPQASLDTEEGTEAGQKVPRRGAVAASTSAAPSASTQSASTELALLIDHLSLSKDENREILRLAQNSIRKITELSDTLVEMKDTVIEAKDTQIEALKERLSLQELQILKLKKSNEDLETLARAMSAQVKTESLP